MDTKNQEILRDIRKEFFAFRNGIIADKLRKANDPHPVIMGCLLTDIVTITRGMKDSIADDDQLIALAEELWSDTNSRECRLAAPMLYPVERMTPETALQWCQNVESTEVADNLCHKLLRYIDGSDELVRLLISDAKALVKYFALATFILCVIYFLLYVWVDSAGTVKFWSGAVRFLLSVIVSTPVCLVVSRILRPE